MEDIKRVRVGEKHGRRGERVRLKKRDNEERLMSGHSQEMADTDHTIVARNKRQIPGRTGLCVRIPNAYLIVVMVL